VPKLDIWGDWPSTGNTTVSSYTSTTMPSSKVPKKLSPMQKRIAELEQQIADKNKTIGALLFLHR